MLLLSRLAAGCDYSFEVSSGSLRHVAIEGGTRLGRVQRRGVVVVAVTGKMS